MKSTRSTASRKAVGKNGKSRAKDNNSEQGRSVAPLIAVAVLLVVAIVAAIILYTTHDSHLVPATYQETLNVFRAQNVSEIIVADLASDFASGNYTLKELSTKYPGYEADIKQADKTLRESASEVVATVNGESITKRELDSQKAMLPQEYLTAMNDSMILQQMIDEKLLLQEAARRGINVSANEVEAAYASLLERANLTATQLDENLATYGLDEQDLHDMLRKQVILALLFNETVDRNLTVTDDEARAFYDENKNSFAIEPTVTVRHILVSVDNTTDDATAKATAEEALAKYEAGADFCDLVAEYTDDLGSKSTCGEYTFGRGYMVPEFENASFALKAGETTIVKTVFGYHVILKVNDTAAGTTPYADVADTIKAQLAAQKRLATYQVFIQGLRNNATIVNTLAPVEEQQESVPTAEGQETNESPATEQQMTPADEEPGETVSDEANLTVPDQPEATNGTATEQTAPQQSFADCLAAQGVTLYVSDVNPASMDEATKLGPDASKIVVDCTDGTDERCAVADGFYPTWVIDDETVTHSLSADELTQQTGCAQ